MTQIDKYIAKATAGLPTRERIDTAAELRVHLNAQVKKHMLEGHTTEEAEFLAVDAMGAVATVNRQFLGHIFTPRVGWGVLIASIVGLAGWFVWMNQERWFMTKGSITEVPGSQIREIAFSTGLSTVAWDIVAPLGTKEIQYALITPNQEPAIGKVMTQDIKKIMEGKSRKTRLYVASNLDTPEKCGKIIVGSGASPINTKICIPKAISPGGSVSPSAHLYSPHENPQLNHWMPLWIVKPPLVETEKDGWRFTENERATTWTALFINFSDTSDGCTNCIPNRNYLKLRDTGDHSYPKLLLDLNDGNSKFFDIVDFKVPRETQKIDLAIARGGQKPIVVENAIEVRANQKLLLSTGQNMNNLVPHDQIKPGIQEQPTQEIQSHTKQTVKPSPIPPNSIPT